MRDREKPLRGGGCLYLQASISGGERIHIVSQRALSIWQGCVKSEWEGCNRVDQLEDSHSSIFRIVERVGDGKRLEKTVTLGCLL